MSQPELETQILSLLSSGGYKPMKPKAIATRLGLTKSQYGHFRRVLRGNPALPQGRTETTGGARWFTLDEVLRLRAHFAAEGSRAKEYRPWRPAGLPAKVAAIANFKGGVGKTSTAAHLAMSAALDGYRVLVVDLDSQGSMTSVFGGRVASEWDTVFPLIARDFALGLQAENRRRAERGDPPLPLEDTLSEALERNAHDVIQKTHWPSRETDGSVTEPSGPPATSSSSLPSGCSSIRSAPGSMIAGVAISVQRVRPVSPRLGART